MNEGEKLELNPKESKDLINNNNDNKMDDKSMMSVDNNLISLKKVKIKTLRSLN